MISIGNELHANVFAPESLVSEIHIGKLVGHKKAIVDGQYLGKSPYFVTIDETNTLFFWDVTNFNPIQNFTYSGKMYPEGLLVHSHDVFWAYGKRFF